MTQPKFVLGGINTDYRLLVFRGSEALGEWPLRATEKTFAEPLRKLKPDLSGVVWGRNGVLAHSSTLSKNNPWWRDASLHIDVD